MIRLQSIINLVDIKKVFKNKLIFKDITFNIPKGSIFAFLGLNGSGKSTLLNIILEILLPTSGKILMYNNKLKKDKIGVVFQENTFDNELTIYENMIIRGKLYNLKKDYLDNKILELVNDLNMTSYLHNKYKYCSGGQKRIAMIAKALLNDPEIIIMDEPTTALDIEARKKVWDYLLKLNKEKNLTIFYSSHYIDEASLATNLCILNKGKIVFNGTYKDLITKHSNKHLEINMQNNTLKKEINSVSSAISYLNKLDFNKINTFSLKNSNLEDIFLKLINNENSYI